MHRSAFSTLIVFLLVAPTLASEGMSLEQTVRLEPGLHFSGSNSFQDSGLDYLEQAGFDRDWCDPLFGCGFDEKNFPYGGNAITSAGVDELPIRLGRSVRELERARLAVKTSTWTLVRIGYPPGEPSTEWGAKTKTSSDIGPALV